MHLTIFLFDLIGALYAQVVGTSALYGAKVQAVEFIRVKDIIYRNAPAAKVRRKCSLPAFAAVGEICLFFQLYNIAVPGHNIIIANGQYGGYPPVPDTL